MNSESTFLPGRLRPSRGRVLLLVLAGALSAHAFLPYPEREGRYPRVPTWDAKLATLWDGWKARHVQIGIVRGTEPFGDSHPTSRAQADGLLLALWMGDQTTFDAIWKTTEDSLWSAPRQGYSRRFGGGDSLPLGDADLRICGALVFASALVDSGYWSDPTTGIGYGARAIALLHGELRSGLGDAATRLVRFDPADPNAYRPGDQAMEWIPVLKEFASSNSVVGIDWDGVRTAMWSFLASQPASSAGFVQNMSQLDGTPSGRGGTIPASSAMGFDAILAPLHIGLAAQWHGDSAALAWGSSTWTHTVVDPSKPGMYTAGPSLWGWCEQELCSENGYPPFLTRSMWGSLAASTPTAAGTAARNTIRTAFEGHLTGDDRLHDLFHDSAWKASRIDGYAQTLALMGALSMGGRAWNVWGDLRHGRGGLPRLPGPLVATPDTILLSAGGTLDTTILRATLPIPARWTLTLVGRSSKARFVATDSGTSVSVAWTSNRHAGLTNFTAETVDAKLAYAGMDSTDPGLATELSLRVATNIVPRGQDFSGRLHRDQDGIRLVLSAELARSGATLTVTDLQGRRLATSIVSTGSPEVRTIVLPVPRGAGLVLLRIQPREAGARASTFPIPSL